MSESKIDNTPDLYHFLLHEFRLSNYYGNSAYGRKKIKNISNLANLARRNLRDLEVDNETLLKVWETCKPLSNTKQPFDQLHIIEEDTGFKHFGFKVINQGNEEFVQLLKAFKKQAERLRKDSKI